MKGGGLRRDIGMLFSNISSPRWRSSEIRIVGKETVKMGVQFSSVQSRHSVVSDSLRPHESQHARPPYPSPIPGVYSISCPSSRWCHPAISSSVVPFSCPQSLPASGCFPMSQLRIGGHVKIQSIGVSASASSKWKQIQWNRIAELTYDIKNNNEITGKHRRIIHRIDVTLI